jgi:cytochrome c5
MAAHSDTANLPGPLGHPGHPPQGGHPAHPAAQAQADSVAHPDDDAHTSFIRTPKQLITVVVLSLFIPISIILLLANFVVSGDRTGAGSDSMTPEAIAARIKPIAGFEFRDASAPQVVRAGEEVYKGVCGACHAAGVAGAPKFGEKEPWAPRIATGLQSLVNSALKGKGAMPPQGGGDYSDIEITKAVVYMTKAAGATFEDPKATEPAAAAGGEAKPEGK